MRQCKGCVFYDPPERRRKKEPGMCSAFDLKTAPTAPACKDYTPIKGDTSFKSVLTVRIAP